MVVALKFLYLPTFKLHNNLTAIRVLNYKIRCENNPALGRGFRP